MNDDKVKSKSLEDENTPSYYEKIVDTLNFTPDNLVSAQQENILPDYNLNEIPSFTIPKQMNTTNNSANTYTNKDVNDLLKRLSVITTKIFMYCNDYCFDNEVERNFFIIIQSEHIVKLYVDVITQSMFKNLDSLTNEWTITSEQCEQNTELNLCINLYFFEEE